MLFIFFGNLLKNRPRMFPWFCQQDMLLLFHFLGSSILPHSLRLQMTLVYMWLLLLLKSIQPNMRYTMTTLLLLNSIQDYMRYKMLLLLLKTFQRCTELQCHHYTLIQQGIVCKMLPLLLNSIQRRMLYKRLLLLLNTFQRCTDL